MTTARPSRATAAGLPRRVLLVGWDAADWQIIHPLVAQGLMPTLAAFLGRGAWGNLATTRPILSPILWNTIATGKRADAHGVLGFTEPDPDGAGIRTTASTSRRAKALWNIFTQQGLRSNVVGWYASHPAEPILGAMVSNQTEFRGAGEEPLSPLPARSVHPAELAEELAECRVHPSELDETAVLPFVPDAARVAARDGNRLGKLMSMVAQTASVQAFATQLMSRADWDFTAVYYEGIDRFGHEFMEFHPPRMQAVPEEDFEAYRHCMTGIYRFHDMMLESLLSLAGEDTAVVIVSDHGYWNDHRRPDPKAAESNPVAWHRPLGIFAAAGPGIRAGARLHGGSILDIAPTVLALLGLPAARDMPGRVLAEALDGVSPPERIASWEAVDGACGMHPADLRVDPVEAHAALEQLVALGYIEPLGADAEKTRRDTVASNQMQLAQSHVDALEFAQAIAVIDALGEPFRATALVRLLRAQCLHGLRDFAGMRAEIESLGGEAALGAPATLLLAGAELAEGDARGALARVDRALAAAEVGAPCDFRTLRARALLALGDAAAARVDLEHALGEEPEDADALCMLADCALRLGDASAALEHGMASAALAIGSPRVHLVIGRAFMALGSPAEAVTAFEAACALGPGWDEACAALEEARRAAVGRA
jgi:predicted AlkP superfamily phosphohydrolase/phosphomutase/tetratricopeptide (TPR) repeat protein